ncbi:hypothetical protein J6W78_09705 [bacterium]|nr:hypothetical protein [bacterium]
MSNLADTFYGRKEYRVDPKGRIPLSTDYYSKLGLNDENSTIIITRCPYRDENCLEVFSEREWAEEQKLIKNMDEGPVKKFLLKKYVGSAESVSLDSQNRIRIPKYMIDFAEIDKDVVFVGEITRLKIWAKERLEQIENDSEVSDELIDEAMNKAKKLVAENRGDE